MLLVYLSAFHGYWVVYPLQLQYLTYVFYASLP
jgi:hypothetical protein